jgi:hypothetical protein
MMKRLSLLFIGAVCAVHAAGCVALLAGAAGGAGTAAWLSGKMTQDVSVSMDKSAAAARKAMGAMELSVTRETKKDEVIQLIGEYSDGRQVWIDIHRVTAGTSRIEVRVGATGDKEAAEKIMAKIQRYL